MLQQREGEQRRHERHGPGNEQRGEGLLGRGECEQRDAALLQRGENGGLREKRAGKGTVSTTISCHSAALCTASDVSRGAERWVA